MTGRRRCGIGTDPRSRVRGTGIPDTRHRHGIGGGGAVFCIIMARLRWISVLLAVVLASPTWALSVPSVRAAVAAVGGGGGGAVDAACCPLCPGMNACLCGCSVTPSDRMPTSPDRDPKAVGPERVAIGGPEIEIGRVEWAVEVLRVGVAGVGPVFVRGPPGVCSVLCRWMT